MSRDYTQEAMNNQFGYQIYRTVFLNEGITPSEIAEKLDSSRKSISNYLKGLRELDLIQKQEKQGRKQPYEAPIKSLLDLWVSMWSHLYHGKVDVDLIQDNLEDFSTLDQLEEKHGEDKVREWPKKFFSEYLKSNEVANIEEMIYDDFAVGIIMVPFLEKDYNNHSMDIIAPAIIQSYVISNNGAKVINELAK